MNTGLPAAKNADLSLSARSAGSLSASAPLAGLLDQAPRQPFCCQQALSWERNKASTQEKGQEHASLPTPTDWATKEGAKITGPRRETRITEKTGV